MTPSFLIIQYTLNACAKPLPPLSMIGQSSCPGCLHRHIQTWSWPCRKCIVTSCEDWYASWTIPLWLSRRSVNWKIKKKTIWDLFGIRFLYLPYQWGVWNKRNTHIAAILASWSKIPRGKLVWPVLCVRSDQGRWSCYRHTSDSETSYLWPLAGGPLGLRVLPSLLPLCMGISLHREQ